MPIEAQLNAATHTGPETKPVAATPLPSQTILTTNSASPVQDSNTVTQSTNGQSVVSNISNPVTDLHSPPEQTETYSQTQGVNAETTTKNTNTTSLGGRIMDLMKDRKGWEKITKVSNDYVSKVNGILHAAASVSSFAHGQQGFFGKINKFFDRVAFAFTKFIAPIISYGTRAAFAFMDKNLIETFIKILPPILMPFVGDANVDVVYGLSTGMNVMHDMADERLKNRVKDSEEFARNYKQESQSYSGFAKLLFTEVKNILKDFLAGKLNMKAVGGVIASVTISGGALPIMLFARKARDTMMAKALGLIRNGGGILGDIFFILDKEFAYRRKTGWLCAGAGLCNIAKRWVGDKWAQILIHAAAAFDVSGYAVWNAHNGSQTEKAA